MNESLFQDMNSIINKYEIYSNAGNIYKIFSYKEDFLSDHYQREECFYEKSFLSSIGEILGKGITCIDAGAHVGNHSIYFAGELDAMVFAIEPEINNYCLLQKNIIENRLSEKIVTYNAAVGEKAGNGTLHHTILRNSGTFSLKRTTENEEKGSISVITLDDTFHDTLSSLEFIKLDVEGSECIALKGAQQLINKFRPIIAAEAINRDNFTVLENQMIKMDYTFLTYFGSTPLCIYVPRERASDYREKFSENLLLSVYDDKKAFIKTRENLRHASAKIEQLENRITQLNNDLSILSQAKNKPLNWKHEKVTGPNAIISYSIPVTAYLKGTLNFKFPSEEFFVEEDKLIFQLQEGKVKYLYSELELTSTPSIRSAEDKFFLARPIAIKIQCREVTGSAYLFVIYIQNGERKTQSAPLANNACHTFDVIPDSRADIQIALRLMGAGSLTLSTLKIDFSELLSPDCN